MQDSTGAEAHVGWLGLEGQQVTFCKQLPAMAGDAKEMAMASAAVVRIFIMGGTLKGGGWGGSDAMGIA